jgi:hypothetical protein
VKIRAPQIAIAAVIGLLLVSQLASLAFAAWCYWQIYFFGGWRDEVYGLVGMTAMTQAMDDYGEGQLRLYTLGGETEESYYTGTNDGPFEVWIPYYYPPLGRAHRYSREQFVEFYNRKMRYMYNHPKTFPRKADVQPVGQANGSQPIRAETNSTSSAAGSRR